MMQTRNRRKTEKMKIANRKRTGIAKIISCLCRRNAGKHSLEKSGGGRKNSANAVQLEEDQEDRSGSMSGSCTDVGGGARNGDASIEAGNFGGYCVDSAGKKAKKIEECIRRQLDEDKAGEQLAM